MFALIDGNSFYCSCERAFDPKLRNKPVVVLSNNDGCAIARTHEAKDLGVAMGEGDYHIALTMPNDPRERSMMLRRVETFMHWKRCVGFLLAVETNEPDAVYSLGINATERFNCLARIQRNPRPWTKANFGAVEWRPESAIDPALAQLLPAAPRPMTPKEISALEEWFGVTGKFPAVHIPTREVRGL